MWPGKLQTSIQKALLIYSPPTLHSDWYCLKNSLCKITNELLPKKTHDVFKT